MHRRHFLVAVLCLSLGGLHADLVVLSSGRTLEGRLIEATDQELRLETFAGPFRIPKARVVRHDPKGGGDFAKYEAAAQAGEKDPSAQLALAKTCLGHRVFARAREHLVRAAALGVEEAKTAALSQEVDKAEAAWRKGLPQPVGVLLKVGTVQVLDEKERTWLIDRVEAASALLFRITNGGLYIQEVVVDVGSPKGHLVYDRAFTGTPEGSGSIPMGPVNWDPAVVVHEMGHALWGLPDDDSAGSGGKWGVSKYPCVMAHQWDQGFGPCCRQRLSAAFRKERLSEFFDRLEEECEGFVPDTQVTWKGAPAPKQARP